MSPDAGTLRLRSSWSEVFVLPARAEFERRLAPYVGARRWFRGKSRTIVGVVVAGVVPVEAQDAAFVIVTVGYEDGGSEDYTLPITAAAPEEAAWVVKEAPHLAVCEAVFENGTRALLCDALGLARFQRAMFALFESEAVLGSPLMTVAFRNIAGPLAAQNAEPRSMTAEQSNTSIAMGDRFILKVTRRLEDGASADLEMGEFLTRAGYRYAPSVAAAAEIERPSRAPATAAIVHRFVANRGDAWSVFLGFVSEAQLGMPGQQGVLLSRLAERVAELHRVLASRPDLPNFSPEVIGRAEREQLVGRAAASFHAALSGVVSRLTELPEDARRAAVALGFRRAELEARFQSFVELRSQLTKIRIHGDLHLGQILCTGDDFALIDFEGEPGRSLDERKAKRCPLADVAGVLRSLHYASAAAARSSAGADPRISARAERWFVEASAAFLSAYAASTEGAVYLPAAGADRAVALDFFVLEKCIYEVQYELDNRPNWVALPLLGLSQCLENRR